MKGRS